MILLFLIGLPILEIYFLFKMSEEIGFFQTFMLIVASGLLGVWLLRNQGYSTMRQMQINAIQNQMPSDALAKGFFTFAGGLLLLIPGFITDIIGLSFIFPPTRFLWQKYFMNKWQSGVNKGRFQFVTFGSRPPWHPPEESESQRHSIQDSSVIDISAKLRHLIKKIRIRRQSEFSGRPQAKTYMTFVGESLFRISLYIAYDTIKLMGKMILLSLLFVFSFPSYSMALCVNVDQANLRTEPSTKAKLAWTVGKYMPLLMVKQKGSWYQVKDFEGKKMWIFSKLVSSRIDCAVVKVGKTILREGPGTKFGKTPLGSAHKYMPFKKLDRDGAWLKLQDDFGYRHWVYEKNLWEPLAYSQITY